MRSSLIHDLAQCLSILSGPTSFKIDANEPHSHATWVVLPWLGLPRKAATGQECPIGNAGGIRADRAALRSPALRATTGLATAPHSLAVGLRELSDVLRLGGVVIV